MHFSSLLECSWWDPRKKRRIPPINLLGPRKTAFRRRLDISRTGACLRPRAISRTVACLRPRAILRAPVAKLSQSPPSGESPQPDSKQALKCLRIGAERTIARRLSHPLNLEVKDELKEKVSTLKINVQDFGQVTISGSSFLINSIGQALAKAMTDRMNESNAQVDMAAQNVAAKPISPGANAAEPAPSPKTVPAETVNAPTAPKPPDWVGKPPFWRSGKGADLPNYYRIVHPTPADGDAYVMTVSTDPYTTVQECEAKIPEVLRVRRRSVRGKISRAQVGRLAATVARSTPATGRGRIRRTLAIAAIALGPYAARSPALEFRPESQRSHQRRQECPAVFRSYAGGHGIHRSVAAFGRNLGLSENGFGHKRRLSQTLAGSRRFCDIINSDGRIAGFAILGLNRRQVVSSQFSVYIYAAVNGKL